MKKISRYKNKKIIGHIMGCLQIILECNSNTAWISVKNIILNFKTLHSKQLAIGN